MEEKNVLILCELLEGIDTLADNEMIAALKWAIEELEKQYCNENQIVKANKINNTEVAPCPFCGEKEEIYLEEYEHKAGKRWRITCCNCMANIDRGYDQAPFTLLEIWNKRTQ